MDSSRYDTWIHGIVGTAKGDVPIADFSGAIGFSLADLLGEPDPTEAPLPFARLTDPRLAIRGLFGGCSAAQKLGGDDPSASIVVSGWSMALRFDGERAQDCLEGDPSLRWDSAVGEDASEIPTKAGWATDTAGESEELSIAAQNGQTWRPMKIRKPDDARRR